MSTIHNNLIDQMPLCMLLWYKVNSIRCVGGKLNSTFLRINFCVVANVFPLYCVTLTTHAFIKGNQQVQHCEHFKWYKKVKMSSPFLCIVTWVEWLNSNALQEVRKYNINVHWYSPEQRSVHPKQSTLLYQLIDINLVIIIIATISTTTLTTSVTGGGRDACKFCSTGLLVIGNNTKCQERVKSVCAKLLSCGQRGRNEVRLLLKETTL